MPLVPFLAGQKLTFTLLNTAFDWDRWVYISVTDQPVISSTTLVNATGMAFSVDASSTYVLEMLLLYDTPAAADFKYDITLPASATKRLALWASGVAATTADATIFHNAVDVGPISAGGVAAGTFMSLRTRGYITTAGTAGTLQLQFAQVTSTATNTKLKAGSWMHLVKVA